MSLERLMGGLADADVSFVVVGMVAGQLYGSRVATYDLDVVYERTDGNIRRLFDYLTSLDAYVKETWPNEGVSSELTLQTLHVEESVTLGTSEGEIDLLHRIDGVGDYGLVLARSRPLSIDNGRSIRVITLRGLIDAKRASDREKDRMHIVELEAIARLGPPGDA